MPLVYLGTGWFIGIALASALHLPIEFGSSLNYVQRTKAAINRGVIRFRLMLCSHIAI